MAWPTLPQEHRDAAVEYLVQRRALLVSIYLILLGLMLVTLFRSNATEIPESFLQSIGVERQAQREQPALAQDAALVAGFLVLQAVFVTGFGRVRVRGIEFARPRFLLSVAIFAVLMSLLSWGVIGGLIEMFDRSQAGPFRREINIGDNTLLVALGVTWMAWLAVSAFALRGVRGSGALARLAGTLLLGSWIEFVTALPIEVVTRPRERDCPCGSGSWLALFVGLPILVWAIGPALVLLFLREIRLWRQNPHRPRAILARKSVWARSGR